MKKRLRTGGVMIRRLKILGIAIAAGLATAALLPSSVLATELIASTYPVEMLGSQPKLEPHVLTLDGYELTCKTANFHGRSIQQSTTLTLTPEYKECAALGLTANWTTNGCDFLLHLPETGSIASFDLICPTGKEVTIDVGNGSCVVHIPPFTGKSHVLLLNKHPDIEAVITLSNIQATMTDVGGASCPLSGETTVKNGTYTGNVRLETEGETIALDDPSPPPDPGTQFTATGYPFTYSGTHSGAEPVTFALDGYEITCGLATFAGGELQESSSTIEATPAYEECTFFGFSSSFSATIKMNGCGYLLHLPEESTVATADLACQSGQEVSISTLGCVIDIPGFKGKPDVKLSNVGEGEVTAEATVTGMKATLTDAIAFFCPLSGNTTTETATYTDHIELTGSQSIHVG